MPRLSPRTLTACGVLTVTLSMVGLAGLQYLMPPSFNNRPAVNQAGIAHFQSVVSTLHSVPLSVSAFVWAFRGLIVGAWLGYGVLLFSCHRYGAGLGRATLPVIGSIALLLAVLFPPSLSFDVYSYAGWGRMTVLHGWSPYTHTLQSLGALGDPAGMVAPVAATSSHGPIWIALVSAVIMVLRDAGLWAQIVALKLLAGLALLLAALSAREIASFYDRKKAELALLAVAFNPVLLIEGPGNGHNDVLMVALMLGGIALCQKRRPGIGYALLGLSAGIKFVTASIVPWLILEQVRRQPPRERFTTVALALALVLAPSVLGYATFRAGLRGFDGIRTVFERQTAGNQEAQMGRRVEEGRSPSATPPGSSAVPQRLAVVLLVFTVLSLVLWRSNVAGRYLTCWALFCLTLIFVAAPIAYPWYFIWPLSVSVIRWDHFGATTTLGCAVLTFAMLLLYTVPFVR